MQKLLLLLDVNDDKWKLLHIHHDINSYNRYFLNGNLVGLNRVKLALNMKIQEHLRHITLIVINYINSII